MSQKLALLALTAVGYGLFVQKEYQESIDIKTLAKDVSDLAKFSKMVDMKGFLPFADNNSALDEQNNISDGQPTEKLLAFLEENLPEKGAFKVGLLHKTLASALTEIAGYKTVVVDGKVHQLLRGCKQHFSKFVKKLNQETLDQAQISLGHAYSRSKVKFNVHKADNMIIQSIALVDQLDKDLNTWCMRVKEWYGYHFPELASVITDNEMYCNVAFFIKDKATFTQDKIEALSEITNDEELAQTVFNRLQLSMGAEISPIDLINIEQFSKRVGELYKYRGQLYQYLTSKMNGCAPNLTALLGEQVGARLISHAGSLTNLAKYPASTVQILGAEKALFRALKSKGNTPKYGLIYKSSFIGRAKPKNKGRISRYLANKTSIASRIDCFTDEPSNAYGKALRQQVEERLAFYQTGKAPTKNVDAMAAVLAQEQEGVQAGATPTSAPVVAAMDVDSDGEEEEEVAVAKKAKKAKKSKKKKSKKE